VHLQCHIGTDTIALARHGARTVGLDVSEAALRVAAELATKCHENIEWIHSDVHDAGATLGRRRFDVVYTGVGALNWLPDLCRWAQVVEQLLQPDGVLYVYEIHPMWIALIEDGRTISEDSIDAEFSFHRGSAEDGSYAAPNCRFANNDTWESLHSISDLLSSVVNAGLTIELFHEFDTTPAPTPWLERGVVRLYHFPAGMHPFPISYSLRARRMA
jgi:SAM-dependent methyltransferase